MYREVSFCETTCEPRMVANSEKEKEVAKNGRHHPKPMSRQVILGLLANFSSIAPSMSLGFSAIALPPLKAVLTSSEASWFASIASLASPIGCMIAGPIADRYGRRSALYVVNLIGLIGWLLLATAYYFPAHLYVLLLIGRLFTGLSTGLCSLPATIYMAEISTPKLRGVFCTWATIFFSIGVLIVYMLGLFFKDNWGAICFITALFPCLGGIFITFLIPESPIWLVRKNYIEEATSSMCRVYGVRECIPEVQAEIDGLLRNRGEKIRSKTKTLPEQILGKLREIIKPSCLKPLGIITLFFFFQQFCGTMAVVFYAIDIVQSAGVTMEPYLTIVLIGVLRLFASIVTSLISRKFGKRPISIVSGAASAICMVPLAVYLLLIHQGKISSSTQDSLVFLPFLLLILYFFTNTIGFLPIPFSMVAEIFPAKVRGTAGGLASGSAYFFNFVAVKIYPSMVDSWGEEGVFFFYGIMALLGTLFVVFFLPETRGKTLEEIEEYFGKKKSKRLSLLKV